MLIYEIDVILNLAQLLFIMQHTIFYTVCILFHESFVVLLRWLVVYCRMNKFDSPGRYWQFAILRPLLINSLDHVLKCAQN